MQKELLYPFTAVIVFIVVLSLMLFVVNPWLGSMKTEVKELKPEKLFFSVKDFNEKIFFIETNFKKMPYFANMNIGSINVFQLVEEANTETLNKNIEEWKKDGFNETTINGMPEDIKFLIKDQIIIAFFFKGKYLETLMIATFEPTSEKVKDIILKAYNKQ